MFLSIFFTIDEYGTIVSSEIGRTMNRSYQSFTMLIIMFKNMDALLQLLRVTFRSVTVIDLSNYTKWHSIQICHYYCYTLDRPAVLLRLGIHISCLVLFFNYIDN